MAGATGEMVGENGGMAGGTGETVGGSGEIGNQPFKSAVQRLFRIFLPFSKPIY